MTKLYANISVEHENDMSVIQRRVIAAAQCNADAVVITKTTPALVIPEEKKYVAIDSKWGNISYIDYARKCELTVDGCEEISNLCEKIGIPIIWCVTDNISAEFVKEHTDCQTLKIHSSAIDIAALSKWSSDNFSHVIFPHSQESFILQKYKSKKEKARYSIYYSHSDQQIVTENLKLSQLDVLVSKHETVGYESRTNTIFPCIATAYKNISYIEKYLGEDNNTNSCLLSPQVMYDFFKNLEVLEIANGQE